LARALEADAAGARPRHHVALGVGDRHRGVVERGVDVGQTVVDDPLLAALLERLLPLAARAFLLVLLRNAGAGVDDFTLRHLDNLLLGNRALARALARPGVGLGALAADRQVAPVAEAAEA